MVDRSRAALLGSHYERWKRRRAQLLGVDPRALGVFTADLHPRILRTFDDSTVASSPHRHRSTMANLMAVKDACLRPSNDSSSVVSHGRLNAREGSQVQLLPGLSRLSAGRRGARGRA